MRYLTVALMLAFSAGCALDLELPTRTADDLCLRTQAALRSLTDRCGDQGIDLSTAQCHNLILSDVREDKVDRCVAWATSVPCSDSVATYPEDDCHITGTHL